MEAFSSPNVPSTRREDDTARFTALPDARLAHDITVHHPLPANDLPAKDPPAAYPHNDLGCGRKRAWSIVGSEKSSQPTVTLARRRTR
ncbi:hypothetical protein CDAR_573881 [Caerostris darwini]|uniref:Uncharacterized protein n=1 Tax=Caerostris darwini TaxID=1538125 RepID=A0AAV4T8Y7_9ARAC|nr:hypothetical protein CDAR_573881 [Caerostris darwini]